MRGIEAVIPHVRHDAYPLTVTDWFTTPHQDLVIGSNEQRVAPSAWLSSGRPVGIVATLAEEI